MNKLSCNIVRDLLPLYCDEFLEKDSMVEIEEHLKNCLECQAVFEKMNSTVLEENELENTRKSPELRRFLNRIKVRNYIIMGLIVLLLVLFFAPIWNMPADSVVVEKVSLESEPDKFESPTKYVDYLIIEYSYNLYSGMKLNFDAEGNKIYIKGTYPLIQLIRSWGETSTVSGSYGTRIEKADEVEYIYFNGKEVWDASTGEDLPNGE